MSVDWVILGAAIVGIGVAVASLMAEDDRSSTINTHYAMIEFTDGSVENVCGGTHYAYVDEGFLKAFAENNVTRRWPVEDIKTFSSFVKEFEDSEIPFDFVCKVRRR